MHWTPAQAASVPDLLRALDMTTRLLAVLLHSTPAGNLTAADHSLALAGRQLWSCIYNGCGLAHFVNTASNDIAAKRAAARQLTISIAKFISGAVRTRAVLSANEIPKSNLVLVSFAVVAMSLPHGDRELGATSAHAACPTALEQLEEHAAMYVGVDACRAVLLLPPEPMDDEMLPLRRALWVLCRGRWHLPNPLDPMVVEAGGLELLAHQMAAVFNPVRSLFD